MALIFNGNLPRLSGNIKIEVPTPTYSGTASSNADDSINPYTSQGPGAGGVGQTKSEIASDRAGEVTDPLFANVSLLMNFDGETNGSTIFTDSSLNAHIFSIVGSPIITTVDAIIGDGSLDVSGGNYNINTPSHTSFHLGANPFTIECFAKLSSVVTGSQQTMVSQWGTGGSNLQFMMGYENDGFSFRSSNGSDFPQIKTVFAPIVGIWYHFAVTRDGNDDVRMFIDGIQGSSTSYTGRTLNATGNALRIGADGVGRFFPGFIDGVRITNGVARYTENFTPPTAAFPTS